ncbi:hypothetical protein GUJ93_ZPchr0013g33942 [Zizania palustris]|uniref:Uncharacterized protein n=1 Tax=Zizania palustris TaxID=103762 RepID=A0A8J5X949_ZIZPA|nr:hypothetical protein GUJ93_ZPchr0013g33942 [Zizania palustris]
MGQPSSRVGSRDCLDSSGLPPWASPGDPRSSLGLGSPRLGPDLRLNPSGEGSSCANLLQPRVLDGGFSLGVRRDKPKPDDFRVDIGGKRLDKGNGGDESERLDPKESPESAHLKKSDGSGGGASQPKDGLGSVSESEDFSEEDVLSNIPAHYFQPIDAKGLAGGAVVGDAEVLLSDIDGKSDVAVVQKSEGAPVALDCAQGVGPDEVEGLEHQLHVSSGLSFLPEDESWQKGILSHLSDAGVGSVSVRGVVDGQAQESFLLQDDEVGQEDVIMDDGFQWKSLAQPRLAEEFVNVDGLLLAQIRQLSRAQAEGIT